MKNEPRKAGSPDRSPVESEFAGSGTGDRRTTGFGNVGDNEQAPRKRTPVWHTFDIATAASIGHTAHSNGRSTG
ncbi:hypothetical protein [Streptosporangium sp. V21-05]|uniref:hypothetical protein n=1 Tax=Streptosporangium sp. V21-05 TaxID=3446115 RepID=UPI003F535F87